MTSAISYARSTHGYPAGKVSPEAKFGWGLSAASRKRLNEAKNYCLPFDTPEITNTSDYQTVLSLGLDELPTVTPEKQTRLAAMIEQIRAFAVKLFLPDRVKAVQELEDNFKNKKAIVPDELVKAILEPADTL